MLSGQIVLHHQVSEIASENSVTSCKAPKATCSSSCALPLTQIYHIKAMAMHDLVPLDQALLPSNLAIAFGLEQPDTDAKADSKAAQRTLLPPGNAAQPAWPVPGGFMPIPHGMPQAAPALQTAKMQPSSYEQQPNGAAVGPQQPSHGRPAQQGAQQASAGPQRTAGPTAPAPASTAGRTDNKDTAGVAMTKKPRVAWTPELHQRFVDAVTELGVHTAVPKAIMQVGRKCQRIGQDLTAPHDAYEA